MIRKRNLDNSLIQWIMTVTGLGPGIGEIKWLAKAASTTSRFSTMLKDNGIDQGDLYATLATTYADVLGYRNDVMLVMPGAYDEAATLDWTKSNLHLIGLGGPNSHSDYSEGNTVIYTDTTTVDYTIHLTGNHCQFINIGINNAGNHATNYAPMLVDGYGHYFKNVTFIGNMQANQLSASACSSLGIYTNAHNCVWDNCQIGEDCWGNRSAANSGQILFSGSQPNGGLFKNCRIKSMSNTATCAAVATVSGVGASRIGRGWFWDTCLFNNYSSSSTEMNEVFHPDGNSAYWPQQLHNCSAFGYDEWSDNDNVVIRGTMPQANDGGGIWIALTDDEA